MPPETIFSSQVVPAPSSSGAQGQPLQPLPKEKKPMILIVGLALSVLLLIASLIFGYLTYGQMTNYKNNSDQISAAAVKKAEEAQKAVLEAQFAEQEKSPLKTYVSPSQFGSVTIVYPKTWSAYVVEQLESGGTPVDGYFYPNFVPNVGANDKNFYNLRIQIVDAVYKNIFDSFKQQISTGKIKAVPFTAEQVKGSATGVRLDGQIFQNKKGAMIIIPLRDKVLKIWTETEAGVADFDTYVLKNLTFSP